MGRSERIALALFLLLSLAAAALAARLGRRIEQGGAARLELGRLRPTALSARTLECFERLDERVLVTYYVSPPADMPAGMRPMELEVTDLLGALRARFPRRFDFHVVDPGEGLEGFAARRRIAPFRVRRVTRDAWDERTVWSTLALSVGSGSEALLRGIGPEHLPHLQELLVGWLEEHERPRAPRIALAAPREGPVSFEELAEALDRRGQLVRVDLDAGEAPPAVDLLFWMRPRRVSGETLRALERLLSTGASVVIAGGRWEALEEVREGLPFVTFRPETDALGELATHFGLRSEPALVLDTTSETLDFDGRSVAASHWVRSIAPNQDFHRFASQPNGTLLFRAASAFTPAPARLAELGLEAEVLATSSDGTWLDPAPSETPIELETLRRDEAQAAAKQALLVALRHDHPWHGELVFASADTPFADGFLHREHVAHPRLLDVLVDEATSSERLVQAGVRLQRAEPLPPLSSSARLAWRFFGIGLPVLLVLLLLHGPGFLDAGLALARRFTSAGRTLARWAVALSLGLALVAGTRAVDERVGLGLDLTAEGSNGLAEAAQRLATRAGAGGEITATLFLSEVSRLPPALRAPARELVSRLAAFRRAGAPLDITRVVPESLDEAARARLAEQGIGPESGATNDDGVTRVTRFTAALRLARGEREVLLSFPDPRSFERLEFRLGLALERLGGRAVPRVAFASDVPRLSAAEAFEDYQKKGLFAPSGTDVFALARESLAQNDLEVVHVNPRAPALPEGSDVLVWLQPRRSIEAMLEATVRHLHGGGDLVLFAQHFKVLAEQYRGGDFAPQFWPRPQVPDVEQLYFPELGIELVREILFDALSVPIATESQVTGRQGTPDYERQDSALPFQIRLATPGFVPHPLTRNLGDQAFLWANRIRWDEARLTELGLRATPLAFTSPRTWSYGWTNGWVPTELLGGPVEIEKSSGADLLGPQPLMALFEGTFPRPAGPLRLHPPSEEQQREEPEGAPWPPAAPGRLVMVGDSSVLENGTLGSDSFRGDHLLWNLVAGMVFEDELAELATRFRAPLGFGWVAPRTRLAWRAGVIGAGPLLLLLGAGAVGLLRQRPRRRGVTP